MSWVQGDEAPGPPEGENLAAIWQRQGRVGCKGSCYDQDPRLVLLNEKQGLVHFLEAPKGWGPAVFLLYCVSIFLAIKWGRAPDSG